MSMTSESEERMINGGPDSPYLDDANSGGSAGGNGQLKKGPWTAQEDQILIDYVMKNGEGNWNAVQKQSGLLRCGKSCRLRWANHLRPDLKKGAFTPEEERCIAELHAKMGNKWAKMAAELPGRTDNEIKNYWNTRIKRRQRAGLPIYPSDICSEALNENHHNDINSFCSGSRTHQDFMSCNNFEIPDFDFKNLELRRQLYPPTFLDIPASAMLDIPKNLLVGPSVASSYPNNSMVHPLKRHRGSPSFFHDNAAIIGGSQYPFVLSSSYEHNSNSNHVSTSAAFSGSHAALNGNPCSSSEPAWAMMKKELPSLQNHMDSWAPQPPSPLPIENIQHSSISPRNSGLLDAVLYESHSLGNQKDFSMPSINGTPIDVIMDSSSHQAQWEVAYGSPLGHSPSPVFSDGSPINGNSFDEAQFADTARGFKVTEEAKCLAPMQYNNKTEVQEREMMFPRPDFLLGSNCFVNNPNNSSIKDHSMMHTDTIGILLGDDYKQRDTSSSSSGQGHDSRAWNIMSTVL